MKCVTLVQLDCFNEVIPERENARASAVAGDNFFILEPAREPVDRVVVSDISTIFALTVTSWSGASSFNWDMVICFGTFVLE